MPRMLAGLSVWQDPLMPECELPKSEGLGSSPLQWA